jgi:mannose-6-phosphate isomerase-like protein (cupin superfamily)
MSAMHVSSLAALEPFITKDGSEIRELVGPAWTPAEKQSLAEATIRPGGATIEHYHRDTEELYYVVEGTGRLRVGDAERDVAVGDCAVIPPGERHTIVNTGGGPLRILCCCAPAYTHEDTVITGEAP